MNALAPLHHRKRCRHPSLADRIRTDDRPSFRGADWNDVLRTPSPRSATSSVD